MSCGCKNDKKIDLLNESNNNDKSIIKKSSNYIVKFILFLIVSLILPITLPLMIIMLFKTIVLDNNINFLPILLKIGKKMEIKEKELYDNEEINSEELELIGVDEIKK